MQSRLSISFLDSLETSVHQQFNEALHSKGTLQIIQFFFKVITLSFLPKNRFLLENQIIN